VEVTATNGKVAVRDFSRQCDALLQFPATDCRNFIAAIKSGSADLHTSVR
jgi:hypothetical protein